MSRSHGFDRTFEVESFAEAHIKLQGYDIHFFRLGNDKFMPLGRFWRIRPLMLF